MATGTNPDLRYCSQCGHPAAVDEFARFGDTLVCPNCKDKYIQKIREGVAPVQPLFRYAGFWVRFVAYMIDVIILGVAGSAVQFLLMGRVLGPLSRVRPDAPPEEALALMGPLLGFAALGTLINTLIGASYEGFFVSRIGATPGKMALGLRVVRPSGGSVTLGRAVGRYFAKWLSGMILLIGYIMAGFDSEKRAMHDMICDTRVIKADAPGAVEPLPVGQV